MDSARRSARPPRPRVPPRTASRSPSSSQSSDVNAGDGRRNESEVRAKTALPPKVVTGKPCAPVGKLVAYFDES